MTKNNSFKHSVRDRMAITGERYTIARKYMNHRGNTFLDADLADFAYTAKDIPIIHEAFNEPGLIIVESTATANVITIRQALMKEALKIGKTVHFVDYETEPAFNTKTLEEFPEENRFNVPLPSSPTFSSQVIKLPGRLDHTTEAYIAQLETIRNVDILFFNTSGASSEAKIIHELAATHTVVVQVHSNPSERQPNGLNLFLNRIDFYAPEATNLTRVRLLIEFHQLGSYFRYPGILPVEYETKKLMAVLPIWSLIRNEMRDAQTDTFTRPQVYSLLRAGGFLTTTDIYENELSRLVANGVMRFDYKQANTYTVDKKDQPFVWDLPE